MHVSVGIVGFRNVDDVVRCVRAVETSTHGDFDVVICENGGVESHTALTEALPATLNGGQSVRIVRASGNIGFPGGVNVCIDEAPDADAWWVLNPDTEPHPEAMGNLVERLSGSDCDAVGGVLLHDDGTVQAYGGFWQSWTARATSLGYGAPASAVPDRAHIEARQNYLVGASMMINRRFRDAVGPMRADYFIYCEESEWCLRALARGMKLGFEPEASVVHHHGTTTGSAREVRQRPRLPIYLEERNRLLLTRDCFPGRLPIAAAAALVLIFARFARRGAWRQVAYGLDGWYDGIRDRRGPPPFLVPH